MFGGLVYRPPPLLSHPDKAASVKIKGRGGGEYNQERYTIIHIKNDRERERERERERKIIVPCSKRSKYL